MGGFYSKHENSENVSKKPSLQIFDSECHKVKYGREIFQNNTTPKKLSPSEILHLHGTIEVQEYEGEEDLHKRYDCCKKYPGHPQFIPIKDFTMEHLPESYHDTDLYDLIKATADLTVRVDVKMTSPFRPKFWPKTKSAYPFYSKRGNVNMRTGSGKIFVHKFIDGQGNNGAGRRIYGITGENIESEYKTCPCNKCVDSDKPNNIWLEIYVATATHVVFDEIEARHTTCRLFYDSDDSPFVTLKKLGLFAVNIESDQCLMKYVTCEEFGKQLYEMKIHECDLWGKVINKYRNRPDVIFIVSHPHGCSKQVSFGHLKDNLKLREFNDKWDMTKLTYTTATCPGSSGAPVYCVGSQVSHVHAGGFDSGLNYSCVAYFKRK